MNYTELGSDLLELTVKGVVVAGILSLAGALFLRGRSAKTSSYYWRIALIGLLLLPFISASLRSIELPLLKAADRGPAPVLAGTGELSMAETVTNREVMDAPGAPAGSNASRTQGSGFGTWFESWGAAFIFLSWAIGFVLILGRWIIARARVAKWRREGSTLNALPLERAKHALGIVDQLRVVAVVQVATPLVWGFRRPLLFVPPQAATWDEHRWCVVLSHELSHAKRGDFLWLLLARVAVAIHWINPLAWKFARRMQVADECAADDAVLEQGHAPESYAQLLADFGRQASPQFVPCPSMAKPSTVGVRVERILDDSQARGRPVLMTRLGFLALGCACVLAGGGAYLGSAEAQAERKRNDNKEGGPTKQRLATEKKLKEIVLPELDLDSVKLNLASAFLAGRAKQLDKAKTGVQIELRGDQLGKREVTRLKLSNVPLAVALNYLAEATNTAYFVDPKGVIVFEEAKGDAGRKDPLKAPPGANRPILAKLKQIVIPVVDFNGVTVEEAVGFLRQRSRELDATEPDPQKKGINFVIRKDIAGKKLGRIQRRNISLGDLLHEIAGQAGCHLKVESFGVVLTPDHKAGPGAKVGGDIQKKLNQIVIPRVMLNNATLTDAAQFLALQSRQHDKGAPKGQGGVTIKMKGDAGERKIAALSLKNVPLAVVLKLICAQTNTKLEINKGVVVIAPNPK